MVKSKSLKLDERMVTGQADRSISEMIAVAHNIDAYDEITKQTLKHHAEDFILAGQHILRKLGQPVPSGDFEQYGKNDGELVDLKGIKGDKVRVRGRR